MKRESGFTLVELLITTVIMAVILGLTFPAFRAVLLGSKTEMASEETYLDKITTLELIRLDLVHTGLGIGINETAKPIEYSANSLTLRSTLNNTNSGTVGWMQFDCPDASGKLDDNVTVDTRDTSGAITNTIVLLDGDKNRIDQTTGTDKFFTYGSATEGVCPGDDVYTGYPTDTAALNGCTNQTCSIIEYTLGGTALDYCANGTQSLLRKVGAGGGNPVLNCVAGIQVRFDLDTTGNGTVDSANQTSLGTLTTSEIIDQVKNIDMYILHQVGKRENDLSSSPDTSIPNDTNASNKLTLSGVTDPENYRWKVLKINGKIMSW